MSEDLNLQNFAVEELGDKRLDGRRVRSIWRAYYQDSAYYDGHVRNFLVQLVPSSMGTCGAKAYGMFCTTILVRPVFLRYGSPMRWQADENFLHAHTDIPAALWADAYDPQYLHMGLTMDELVTQLVKDTLLGMPLGNIDWGTIEVTPPKDWEKEE